MTVENKKSETKFTKFSSTLSKNQVVFTVIVFLYLLPLFTNSSSDQTGTLRSLINMFTEFMIFGIFALSFDLQLGRTGLLNFGQAAFFGIGAYLTAWCLKLVLPSPIGDLLFLIPFPFTLIVAIIGGACVGLIMGSTTNRMKGTAFAFIALAIAMLILEFMELKENIPISGGESGIIITIPPLLTEWIFYMVVAGLVLLLFLLFLLMVFLDIKERSSISYFRIKKRLSALSYSENDKPALSKTIFGIIIVLLLFTLISIFAIPNIMNMYDLAKDNTFRIPNQYWIVLTITLIIYFSVKRMIDSPFGRVLAAIAQNEDRVKALGYNTFKYKVLSVTISGAIGAIAGSLMVTYNTTISTPTTFGIDQAIDAMLFTIMGGLGTLLGPFVGASLIKFSEIRMVEFLEIFNIEGQWWLVLLGLIYIIIILFFPYGIVGSIQTRSKSIKSNLFRYLRIKENDYWWLALISLLLLIFVLLEII